MTCAHSGDVLIISGSRQRNTLRGNLINTQAERKITKTEMAKSFGQMMTIDDHDHGKDDNCGGDDNKATLADIPSLTSALFA